MHKLRVFVVLLLVGCATFDVAKSEDPKTVESSVSSTVLTKTTTEGETKSKTEKRDSSDQTASYADKPKDEPFRPIYRAQHYQQQQQQQQEAGASLSAFRAPPTTVRYVAAEAAAAAATPQAYYDKSELTGGIHYAASAANTVTAHNAPAAPANTGGGILYASSAYRGPFSAAYSKQQQQQPRNQAEHAAPQQVKMAPPNSASVASPQAPQTYAYAEPDAAYMYERMPQHQQQQQLLLKHPQHLQHHYQRPVYHREPQQQQIQYVIAIPLSYMRQLQHQISAIPTHASQAYSVQPSAPPHMLQSIGPLARDHQGMYRPYHSATAAASTAAPPPHADAASPVANAPYSTQFIQLPASAILAAAKALYQHQQPSYPQQQQQQQQLYYTPQHILQPAVYHPHHHSQQLQPLQQLAPLYAYPVQQQHHQQQQNQQQQQHQHQQQQQQQKQQQLHTVVRIGGVKPNPNAKLSQQHAPTAPHPPPTSAAPHQPTSLVNYNPVYLQAPPTEQQAHPGAFSFARFSQSLHGGGPLSPPHFVRLSAPSTVVAAAAAPQPHYYSYETAAAPMQDGSYDGKLSYAAMVPSYTNSAQEAPLQAPPLPYFTHPGAVHYGSHLYHPPTPTSTLTKASQSVAAMPDAAGNQPQPHAASSGHLLHSSAAAAAGDNTVVKYP